MSTSSSDAELVRLVREKLRLLEQREALKKKLKELQLEKEIEMYEQEEEEYSEEEYVTRRNARRRSNKTRRRDSEVVIIKATFKQTGVMPMQALTGRQRVWLTQDSERSDDGFGYEAGPILECDVGFNVQVAVFRMCVWSCYVVCGRHLFEAQLWQICI